MEELLEYLEARLQFLNGIHPDNRVLGRINELEDTIVKIRELINSNLK